jgi:hypothetical protein
VRNENFTLTQDQAELLLTLGSEREVVGDCEANVLAIKRARPLWVSVIQIGDVTLAKATSGGRRAAQIALAGFARDELLRQNAAGISAEEKPQDGSGADLKSGPLIPLLVQGIAEGLSSGLRTLADEIVRLRKENEELRKKLAKGVAS